MKEVEVIVKPHIEPTKEDLLELASKASGILARRISSIRILRRSLDARGGDIKYRYRLMVYQEGESISEKQLMPFKDVSKSSSILIIGAGPAGLFAALKLIQLGLKPIVLDRGKDVHGRKYDIAKLSREGVVNEDSNYCFGEGGAGTFSDGKLYTRSSKRGDVGEVLKLFIEFGAQPEIEIDAHPHIGSDRLPRVIENIRMKIIECGGEIHFDSKVEDLIQTNYGWRVVCSDKDFESKSVILATGHSASDIYYMFERKGWPLEVKGFALGVRAEHPQMLINQIQYHKKYQPFLPAAQYSLVTQVEGRGVYSFCMCPGGILVPSSTSPDELVLNGMSNSFRDSRWANSGIVVSVNPEDVPEYEKYGVTSLLRFREAVEREMFGFSNSIKAPAQRLTDFVKGVPSQNLPASSYHPGVLSAPLGELLPDFITSRLREAFRHFDRKMRGYLTSEAMVLGVESRTSSPIRIPRDPISLQHISLNGLYPCGEGAGYAGGIVSSALDGIAVAEKIAERKAL